MGHAATSSLFIFDFIYLKIVLAVRSGPVGEALDAIKVVQTQLHTKLDGENLQRKQQDGDQRKFVDSQKPNTQAHGNNAQLHSPVQRIPAGLPDEIRKRKNVNVVSNQPAFSQGQWGSCCFFSQSAN